MNWGLSSSQLAIAESSRRTNVRSQSAGWSLGQLGGIAIPTPPQAWAAVCGCHPHLVLQLDGDLPSDVLVVVCLVRCQAGVPPSLADVVLAVGVHGADATVFSTASKCVFYSSLHV